jgi:hypothetical protein
MITASPRTRTGVVVVAVVLVVSAAGWAGARYVAERQEDAWQAGHAALLQGDCATAVPELRTAADRLPGTTADVARLAEADEARCDRVQQVEREHPGRPGEQLAAYATLMGQGDDEALHTLARDVGRRLLDRTPPAQLATDAMCEDAIVVANLVARPGAGAPELLGACVARVDEAGDAAAVSTLGAFFLEQHATHALAADVTARYARALVGEARADAGPLGAALEGPAPDAPAGQDFIEVQNNTQRTMTVVLSGPVGQVHTVPGCPQCAVPDTELGACVGEPQGKLARYAVPRGTYDVLVTLRTETDYVAGSTSSLARWNVRPDRFSRVCLIDVPSD